MFSYTCLIWLLGLFKERPFSIYDPFLQQHQQHLNPTRSNFNFFCCPLLTYHTKQDCTINLWLFSSYEDQLFHLLIFLQVHAAQVVSSISRAISREAFAFHQVFSWGRHHHLLASSVQFHFQTPHAAHFPFPFAVLAHNLLFTIPTASRTVQLLTLRVRYLLTSLYVSIPLQISKLRGQRLLLVFLITEQEPALQHCFISASRQTLHSPGINFISFN